MIYNFSASGRSHTRTRLRRSVQGKTKTKITAAECLALFGIAATAFIFNTSEFMPVALLVSIASDFAVSEAEAGMLITAYAWAVCLLSPILMIVASRFEFKSLLLGIVALFALCQIGSAFAPGYWWLMAARIGVACSHAIFWSIASIVATRVVTEEHQSVALSFVIAGSSVAMICGLPLGRVVGLALGWRMTFLCVAVVSLASLAYLAAVLPKLPACEPFAIRKLPHLFKNPVLVGIYVTIAVFTTGYYTGYSYIEPFFLQVGGFSENAITMALSLFGVAGVAGSMLFARFYEGRRRRFAFLLATTGGIAAALLLMRPAAPFVAAAFGVCMLWGACSTSFNVAFQAEILRFSSDDEAAVAMSFYSGIFNLGIGGGSAVGGLVVNVASVGVVGLAGGVIALLGVALCAWRLIPAMSGTLSKGTRHCSTSEVLRTVQ